MKIQLLTFPGCPNAEPARGALVRVASELGLDVVIDEIDTTADDTPAALRDWGSPTILIEGKDVGGATQPTGACCRLYGGVASLNNGVPADADIRAALARAARS